MLFFRFSREKSVFFPLCLYGFPLSALLRARTHSTSVRSPVCESMM